MGKMAATNLEELFLLAGAENFMVELLVEALRDVGEIPFHLMNLSIRTVDFYLFTRGFFPELLNVGKKIQASGSRDRPLAVRRP